MSADREATRQAFRRVFPGIMVAMFLAAADQTILASALPTIASSLHGFADLSWVVIAYLLAATIAAPLYGHLSDHFGRRRMLMTALALFTLASAACAFAPTLPALIVARALQGLGGGGLMTLAQALIGEHVPPRERGRFAGYFAVLFTLSSTAGPILGAYLTEHFGWRAVFTINLPLGVVAWLLAMRIPVMHAARRPKSFRLDFVGAILFAVATAALLYALSSAGHRYGWGDWQLLALVAVAGFGYVALWSWETRVEHPVIPVRFLRYPAIIRSDVVVFCFAATLFGTVLYLPLYLQLGRGVGIGTSGLLLLPITLTMALVSSLVGRLIAHTGNTTLFPQAGLALASVAFLLLAASVVSAPTWTVMTLTGFVGMGLSMVMPPTQVVVQHAAGRDALGAATATIAFSRSVGGAVGTAIVGTLLVALLGASGTGLPVSIDRAIEAGGGNREALSQADREALVSRLDGSYRVIFLVLAGIAAAGAAVARTVPQPDWDAEDAVPATAGQGGERT